MWPLPYIHSPSQSLSHRVDSLHGPSSTTFISTNHLIRALTQTYTHTHTLPGHVWHREKSLSNSKTNSAHSSCHHFTRGMATLLIQFMLTKFIFLRNRTNVWLYSREASASQQNNNANQILLSTEFESMISAWGQRVDTDALHICQFHHVPIQYWFLPY